jgi:dienelactone hydrolase
MMRIFPQTYARWMHAWETRLSNEDSNRVIRPLEWGFDLLADVDPLAAEMAARGDSVSPVEAEHAMLQINQHIAADSDRFFGYATPTDFRLEERHPRLFPTNVRPATLKREAAWNQRIAAGKVKPAQFLRFTSPARTAFKENDLANARWFPAPEHTDPKRPKQAIVVMPQWNADAFSHNALCHAFNRFGVSALRLSKPFHDVRRPPNLERSDFAVSANVGLTIATARQAVVDIRCCLDWLQQQGYTQFGVLGTSLGSCYAYLASAHDARLEVNAFNHASTWVGDVVWDGQSTRHVRAGFEQAGFLGEAGKQRLRALWRTISPPQHREKFAAKRKTVRVIYADYDLTFPRELSLKVIEGFREDGVDFDYKVLPCGHYTTGETPFQYLDGWWLGSYIYQAFKRLRNGACPTAAKQVLDAESAVATNTKFGKNPAQCCEIPEQG